MLTRRTALVALLGAALAMVGLAPTAQAADKNATGTWKWTQQMGRRGGQDGGNDNNQQRPAREFTLKLKQDGEKLTGTLMAPAGGRRGGQDGGQGGQGNAQARETEIKNGKIAADGTLSFEVTRQGRGGNEMTTKYKGKLDGDTIKGTTAFETPNGAQERPWEAKRATDSDKKA